MRLHHKIFMPRLLTAVAEHQSHNDPSASVLVVRRSLVHRSLA